MVCDIKQRTLSELDQKIAALESAQKFDPDSPMGKQIPEILEGLRKQAEKHAEK